MFFKLTPMTGQPLYLQLMQQIRHAAESGALQDGDQLPGIRTLAEELETDTNGKSLVGALWTITCNDGATHPDAKATAATY